MVSCVLLSEKNANICRFTTMLLNILQLDVPVFDVRNMKDIPVGVINVTNLSAQEICDGGTNAKEVKMQRMGKMTTGKLLRWLRQDTRLQSQLTRQPQE